MPRPLHPLFRALSLLVTCGLLASACGSASSFVALTTQNPVAQLPEGLSVSASPATLPSDFRVQLSAVPASTFAGGGAGDAWAAALKALPANLRLMSALFAISTQGHLPQQMFVSVVVPAGADASVLDLYAWNGKSWDFLPAQAQGGELVATVAQPPAALGLFEAALLPPLALTVLEPGQSLTQAAAGAFNAVLLDGVLLQSDGSLGGQVPGVPLHQGYAVYPIVGDQSLSGGQLSPLLSDPASRLKHLQSLVAFAVSGGYDGLVLNYAGVTPDLGPSYAQFVADLADQLHGQSKTLLVQVPPPARNGDLFQTGGYDWRVLGFSVDALLAPVSDDPAAFGNGLADALFHWAVGEVPRGRLRLLTSAMSVQDTAGQFTRVDQAAVLAPLGSVTLSDTVATPHPGEPIAVKLSGQVQSLAYDTQAFAPRYTYTDTAGAAHTLWLTTGSTLRQRLTVAQKYRLGGIALADLQVSGVPIDMLNAITQYKAAMQADAAAAAHAELLWTVRGSGGILALATAQPNEPYVYVAPSAGNYQFSANLQPGAPQPLGSVSVQVAEVTNTPTPVPATATPTARPTSVPRVVVPTSSGGGGPPAPTQPPANNGGGFVPPPPIGAGTFQLGGQVPGGIGHAAQMKQGGMTWVKFQITGCDASGQIAAGHAAGFKVLASYKPADTSRAADPSYWPEYAACAAGMAAAGADAIEVWNEANIDADWPAGQISGVTYTGLLKQAYAAIKGANGGTLVISGAPSPTGAAAAFPGRVMNDNDFIAQMASSGAANYMDCVGVHYNEGIVSPKQSSGDPRDNYYSRYFPSMVDLYYGSFGGSRPLCFTELGYLTPEGYPPLPAYFGWAGNTTVAEQAQWLADAASLAGNSGKVRLMIVWNVDFTQYSSDPQAGYAIVRPGGGCPACAALGAVVH